ncbi:cerevisin [Malassezia sp. CBS 17886]|nr:cerevisin [Malassezia sp. CBS 17886]
MLFRRTVCAVAATLLIAAATSGGAHALPSTLRPVFQPGVSTYATGSATVAPLLSGPAEPIAEKFIVVLKPGVSTVDFFQHRERTAGAQAAADVWLQHHSGATARPASGLGHIYDMGTEFQGYAGEFTPDVLAFIRAQPEVDYVEKDTVVSVQMLDQGAERVWHVPQDVPFRDAEAPHARALPWHDPYAHHTEKGAPWGLARISHRKSLTLGTFNQYVYEEAGGEGVTAYVIECVAAWCMLTYTSTGINVDHEDFEGRASWGKTIPLNDVDEDGHGHGTHCAGTIGSATYGVAKKTHLVAVKVLGSGGSGSMSDVTAGILWATADAKRRSQEMLADPASAAAKKFRGFVANMSLGGGRSPTLDRAVDGAVASGMHFAVAAGNENQDACLVSPAAAKNPITVGASTIGDDRAYFSNTGECVDIFAPGLNVLSTWNAGGRSVNTISGTSMASPHIVGLLSYLLSIYGSDDFALVKDAVPMRFGPHRPSSWAADAQRAIESVQAALPLVFQSLTHYPLRWLSLGVSPKAPLMPIESALHPRDMKKAMRKFASPGLLGDVERDTVNLLAYNNATSV